MSDKKPTRKKPIHYGALSPEVKLNFDPMDHDRKIEARLSEEAKGKARSVISKAYVEWKRQTQRLIKQKKIQTKQDLIKQVYVLQEIVAREASGPEMYEWRSFTLNLIEDKIGEIIITNGWSKNLFTEFIPEGANPHVFTIPQRHAFGTLEEFQAIPFVNQFLQKVGFLGFVRDGRGIWAMFKDGEIARVGVVADVKGLEQLPTRYEIQRELRKDEQ